MNKEAIRAIYSYCSEPRTKQEIVEFTRLSKRQVGYFLKLLVKTKRLSKYHNLNDLRSHYYKSEVNEISIDTM